MNGLLKSTASTQLEVATGSLLKSLADKSSLVCESSINSLIKLSEVDPNPILLSCLNFCMATPKPNNEHIGVILSIMNRICMEKITCINDDNVSKLIEFSLKTMTENYIHEPIIQMPASEILVALGRKHYIQVTESLINKLNGGVMPHYTVPHTLGALASSNAFKVVPYLKDILTKMLRFLGGVKTDYLKQAFSFAIHHFCEALIEYVSNVEHVPDPTITTDSLKHELNMIYDVLFSSWLQSKDPKVVEMALDALCVLFLTLSTEKATSQIPKILPILLNLLKKNSDTYVVVKCLYSVISKATNENGMLLEPFLSNILNNLSNLICTSPDYAQPDLLRSHSEVLRCYESLTLHFTDIILDNLFNHYLKNNNEKEKLKGLIIVAHLITYSPEQTIKGRLKDLLKCMNDLLLENHIKIKKILVKIIVVLARKGILIDKSLNPDGPKKFLEFIVKMCCKQIVPKNNDIDKGELEDIQKSADNALYMLTTSLQELKNVLWDLLLNCFLIMAYDDAIVILLQCLTILAARIESTTNCEAAFIRCMILLSNPTAQSFRGTYVLNFLKSIQPLNAAGKNVWDLKLPHLLEYLEENCDTINFVEWQVLQENFLTLFLEAANDEMLYEKLLENAKNQLELYNDHKNMRFSDKDEMQIKVSEKRFLLKLIAVILCCLKSKVLVLNTLDNLLVNVRLTDYSELEACSQAVGICSRVHLEAVLEKLSNIRKEILNKKPSKLFSFMKDQKSELGVERLRYVIICSYSEICNEAPGILLLRVIETEILEFVLTELINSKDFSIKKICLKAITSVADAMHPNRNTLHIRMTERLKVIEGISAQMHLHSGPDYIELFPLIIPAITSLIKLPVPLESDDRIKLMKLLFDNVYNASAIYCKINPDNHDNYYGDLKMVPYVTKSFMELHQFVQELLLQNLTPATLDALLTLLEPWLAKRKAEQRLPALEALRLVLETYLVNMKFAYDCPSSFHQTGMLLAKVIPRCTDPNKNIRKAAVESVNLILCIAARYEGHMQNHDKVLTGKLQFIDQNIQSNDMKFVFNLVSDLAELICANLPQFQIIHYVEGLIDAILDCEPLGSNGSAIVLAVTLRNKGNELQNSVTRITEHLITQLNSIKCPTTKASALKAILHLASHHPQNVGGILLMQPLPFESIICDCWSVLSHDHILVRCLIDQIKKMIKTTPIYDEQNGGDIKIANFSPLQAVSALHELLKNTQLKPICLEHFSELFALLVICLASYAGCAAPAIHLSTDKKEKYGSPLNRDAYKLNLSKITLETLKLFFICCDLKTTASILQNYITNVDLNENKYLFIEIIEELVNNISIEYPQSLPWIVNSLGPFIRSELEPQKIAVIGFFTYLLKQGIKHEQTILIENILEMILDVQLDQSYLVRKIALEGLGYAAENLSQEVVSRYCNQILGVLMNSLDYNSLGNENEVTLAAIITFSKLLNALEGYKFHSFQVTAAVRIKPLLSQDHNELRRAALHLFGDLTASLNIEANLEAFKEQIQGNLVTLLLHLNDPDDAVVKACKFTLRKIGPYLDSPDVNQMIQEHLIDDANLHYSNFIKDLIKIMSKYLQDLFPLFIMTSVSYLKSSCDEIRSSAVLLTGLLYAALTIENKHKVSLDVICDKLIRLLQEDTEDIKIKASQALVNLFAG